MDQLRSQLQISGPAEPIDSEKAFKKHQTKTGHLNCSNDHLYGKTSPKNTLSFGHFPNWGGGAPSQCDFDTFLIINFPQNQYVLGTKKYGGSISPAELI